ncbi:hypothetical protein D7U98_22925 [Stenotrophomonas maltophilia]|uniref:Uncharacterized protein n=2 Tax=Stenotrophomonas maltophilia TaxID=40324 RepID=B4SMM6_STRM5|nr:hypothetical protein [Stenotrophomonas maltophilia]ACF52088.1 conserved hypothetical protein [Stenotrophomonas maltophilia R551-3]MBA0398228.1 hypothetical protein [Stenotrophomonas maltophilia]MBH1494291.1 hypothetical protein [Stenotrophomonas maltophilia]MBN4963826.1 hypothetical protein [Stenotrophomonas maltophilia]MBN5144260.1 hypothetical protein [Stenotrophomonas maltophilia]
MNYRLQIHRDGVYWGHFDCSGPDALRRMDNIAAQLPADQGFQLQRQKGVGEERILSSNADGLRVLASQIQYCDI